ncbi:MAG: 5-methylcytosine restriction system specificity protein McrC [Thermoguttaceae bacterium]
MSSVKFTPSPEQQAVIDHRGGHLQVIACAGAGKTEAISRRVASLFTLFEHDVADFDWSDKDVAVLDRLTQKAGAELLRPVVRNGKKALLATQYVGVFRLGSRTVQVLPKIYRAEETTDPAKRATRNLLHMLQIANEVQIREQGLAKLLKENMDWFEILTRLFALHLREEWQRGPSRGYLLVEDDLPTLKGKWRIAEQIRRPRRDHLFSVAYDEFTADIPLNRVFRFVVERLWGATRDGENRQILGELRQWLDEVTVLPFVTASDASPSLLTRLNRRLEPLLNLARLFLDGGTLQLAAKDLSAFAFVFDMNRVFEGFVVNFVCKHRQEILPLELRDCDLLPQARGVSRCLATSDGKSRFHLKPDLAVRSGGTFPLLMDAKYKRLEPDVSGASVSQGDFYQMFAYAQRYDCPRVLMLYPQTADMPNEGCWEFVLGGTNGKTVVAATVDVRDDVCSAKGRTQLVERLGKLFQEHRCCHD